MRMIPLVTALAMAGVVGLAGCSTSLDTGQDAGSDAGVVPAGMPNVVQGTEGLGARAGDPGCAPTDRIAARVLCFSVTSTAQVFAPSKPGQPVALQPASFVRDPDQASSGDTMGCQPPTDPQPFPETFTTSAFAIYQACYWGGQARKSGFYSVQDPLPHADRVQLFAANPVDANNVAACNQPTYLWCKISPFDAGTQTPVFGFTLGNSPLTVQVQNNLPSGNGNVLELVGQPAVTRLALDPNVATASKIEAGSSGYFGGYLAVPTAAMVNPTVPSGGYPNAGFAAVYQVPATATGTQAKGTVFLVDATFDAQSGLLTNDSSCTAQTPSQFDQSPICVLTLTGNPNSSRTLTVDINEGGQ